MILYGDDSWLSSTQMMRSLSLTSASLDIQVWLWLLQLRRINPAAEIIPVRADIDHEICELIQAQLDLTIAVLFGLPLSRKAKLKHMFLMKRVEVPDDAYNFYLDDKASLFA